MDVLLLLLSLGCITLVIRGFSLNIIYPKSYEGFTRRMTHLIWKVSPLQVEGEIPVGLIVETGTTFFAAQ